MTSLLVGQRSKCFASPKKLLFQTGFERLDEYDAGLGVDGREPELDRGDRFERDDAVAGSDFKRPVFGGQDKAPADGDRQVDQDRARAQDAAGGDPSGRADQPAGGRSELRTRRL